MNNVKEVQIKDIVVLPEVYPRAEIDQNQVNMYRQNLAELPPIVISHENILIDGAHRLQAHEIDRKEVIEAEIEELSKDKILVEAIKRNAKHGKQLTLNEKKRNAIKLFEADRDADLSVFAVSDKTLTRWLKEIKIGDKKEVNDQIWNLFLQCKTQSEIAKELDIHQPTVSRSLPIIQKGQLSEMNKTPDSLQLTDHWRFMQCDPQYGTKDYPGRCAGQIVENLIYYTTEPFDLVVDPMAGGGTTGDVAKAMNRKFLMYDLHPLKSRPIVKQHDITKGFPEEANNSQLILLDPPYFKMKDKEYHDGSVSDLDKMGFINFIQKLVQDSYNILKDKGYCALLYQDSYKGVKGLYKDTEPLFTYEFLPYFDAVGFKPTYWISIPLVQHHQYDGIKTNRAKEAKVPLHVVRHLVIFQK